MKKRSETDHRSSRLELSGEGEELLDRIEAARLFAAASLGDPLDVLSPDERTRFRSALEKVELRARELFGP